MRVGFGATLKKWSREFCASEKGNVAITFGLVAIPLLVSVGGLIDYGRSVMARTDMQDAHDATALALARQTNVASMSSSDMKTFASEYFTATFTNTEPRTV